MGGGRSRGPGWRIVRSIVRLLYLVPSSFCGSLSHPFPRPRSERLRLRLSRSGYPTLTFVCRASSSRSYPCSRFHSSSFLSVPFSLSLLFSFSHLPDLTLSPFLSLPSSSLHLPPSRILSFSGLVSIVSHYHHQYYYYYYYYYYLNTVTSSSQPSSWLSERKGAKDRKVERRERGGERETRIRARVWPQ